MFLSPEFDAKWRFFWRIGPKPKETKFASLNMDPVLPPEIPEWSTVMDGWGNKMLNSVQVIAEMAAVGFNMPQDAFTSRMVSYKRMHKTQYQYSPPTNHLLSTLN